MCAERVALYYACSAYPKARVMALAVAARDASGEWVASITPCGACRQVMSEVIRRHGSDFDVVLAGKEGRLTLLRASALLPHPFEP
jgi:cytidine deaminase